MSYFDAVCDCFLSVMRKSKNHLDFYGGGQSEDGFFGWEKWLQMEMAVNLIKDGHFAKVEEKYLYDKRMNLPNSKSEFENCYVDLILRKRNYTDLWVSAIELKVAKSIGGMKFVLADFEKIGAIRKNDWNIRSVVGLLVTSKTLRGSKYDDLTRELEYLKLRSHKFCRIEFKNSNFDVLVIGWEVSLIDKMSRDRFNTWLAEMRKIYQKYGVVLEKTRVKGN